jgi:hypothetical protein
MKTLRLVTVSTVITELVVLSFTSYYYQCSIDNYWFSSKSWKYGPTLSKTTDKVWLSLREMYAQWQQDTSTIIIDIIMAGNISLALEAIHESGTIWSSPIRNILQTYDSQTYLHTIYDPSPPPLSKSEHHDTFSSSSSSTVNEFQRIINRFSQTEDTSEGSQHWTDILYFTSTPLLFSNLGDTSWSAVNIHDRVAVYIMNHTSDKSSKNQVTTEPKMKLAQKVMSRLSKYDGSDDWNSNNNVNVGFDRHGCVNDDSIQQLSDHDNDNTSRDVELRVEIFKLKRTIELLNKTIDMMNKQGNRFSHTELQKV